MTIEASELPSEGDAVSSRGGAGAGALPLGATIGLFVASGAAGLVDQVCFSKYLSYVVGATAYAISAVLAAFMTGLALGAYWGGKASLRVARPVMVYGALELLVAAAVAIAPFEFDALATLYANVARRAPESVALLSGLRWLVALAIVIVPTTAMGATLPILTRALRDGTGTGSRERQLGALYAANTCGGAGGALLAAYWVLPALGLRGTVFAAAALSALVGIAALRLGREVTPAPLDAEHPTTHAKAAVSSREPTEREVWVVVGLAFLSGCLAFAAEVIFTHLLALLIGNSAYAFGLILAVFLLCLFAGAARAGAFRARFGESALALGLVGTALALALTLPLWDQLPRLFAALKNVVRTFGGREVVRALAALLILCVPTTLMGLTFPVLLQRAATTREPSRWVGKLTAINTIGAVVGALGTGYVLLPLVGSQRSLELVVVLFALSAVGAATLIAPAARRKLFGFAAAACVVTPLLPRWNLARLTGGSNVYFEKWVEPESIPFLREDVHGGVTTVTDDKGVLTLYTNGKFQGNTGWEMSAQRFFAHYPSLFVSRFDAALVIGLGTGTTLGTLAAYPWKKLDVVEISPSIVEAARRYFTLGNLGAIEDPRVTIHHADGRNFVLVDDHQYDLISMELSSIWFAGASNLYSREFYDLVRKRLRPGGVFQQWVQLHHVYRRDFATVVGTLRSEFKHVALFYGGGQGILVASEDPLSASMTRLDRLAARPELQRVLSDERHLADLTADILSLDDGLDAFLAESAAQAGLERSALISTDQSLYLEYATPRGNILPWSTRDALVADVWRFRNQDAINALLTP
ncbi:MAG TPA: fused MFS/spermidine synthase [Polyangiaceae bacterium]|nr:fused MFS/spermidine synthase [Polyangiaceae bacterium]